MIKKNPLYVVLDTAVVGEVKLELRTDSDWIGPPRVRIEDGVVSVKLPAPIIPVAAGALSEVLALSHTLFGTPLDVKQSADKADKAAEGEWRYLEDYTFVFFWQEGDD